MKSIKYLLTWIVLLCLTLGSCNFGKLRKQDIVGVWREDDIRCKSEVNNCAIFEFKDDGQFIARNLPSKYFGYIYSTHNVMYNATGVWTLEITEDPLENDKIRLNFDPVPELGYPAYNSLLYVSGKKGRLNLFQWFGDESDSVYFIEILPDKTEK